MLLDGVFGATGDELETGSVSNWTLNFNTEQLCNKCVIKAMLLDGVFGATGDELETGGDWTLLICKVVNLLTDKIP